MAMLLVVRVDGDDQVVESILRVVDNFGPVAFHLQAIHRDLDFEGLVKDEDLAIVHYHEATVPTWKLFALLHSRFDLIPINVALL